MLADAMRMLDDAIPQQVAGRVADVRGLAVRCSGITAPVGSSVTLRPRVGHTDGLPGQVVGFDGPLAVVMALGRDQGIGRGDPVEVAHATASVRCGGGLLGRVVDALGRPIDGLGPIAGMTRPRPLDPPPLPSLGREIVAEPFATGIRAIDGFMPLGRGQRIGVFAPPGVGKSTLLAGIARRSTADVNVLALVGERGREVREFVEQTLGPEGLARSVVVVATGDEPALLRLRAAKAATTIAEDLRDRGLHVLLMVDSVTRFCQAQRQVGLAVGEPPATRGYPPSVFAAIPALLERAGPSAVGATTAVSSVLVEGEDLSEPIADTCRGVLDGHVLLDRELAERGRYPAIDLNGSISRVADAVSDSEFTAARRRLLGLLAAEREVRELVQIGAYAAGSNPDADLAIRHRPAMDRFLLQSGGGGSTHAQPADFAQTRAQVLALNAACVAEPH